MNKAMTPERLAEIARRAGDSAPCRHGMAVHIEEGHVAVESDSHTMTMADVDFYEHAREDALTLLAALATVTAERDDARAQLAHIEAMKRNWGQT